MRLADVVIVRVLRVCEAWRGPEGWDVVAEDEVVAKVELDVVCELSWLQVSTISTMESSKGEISIAFLFGLRIAGGFTGVPWHLCCL